MKRTKCRIWISLSLLLFVPYLYLLRTYKIDDGAISADPNSWLKPDNIPLPPSSDITLTSEELEQACVEATATDYQFDANCNSNSLTMFYVGMSPGYVHQAFPSVPERDMFSFCSEQTESLNSRDGALNLTIRNANDLLALLDSSEFCVVARQKQALDLEYIKKLDARVTFHEQRACEAFSKGIFRVNQFYKVCLGNDKPIAFVNIHAFYTPMLVMVRDAFVSKYGNIGSIRNLVQFTYTSACYDPYFPDMDSFRNNTLAAIAEYDEVFVVSQHSCWGTFHALAECLPRLAVHYEYLIMHRDIKIHTTFDHGRSGGIESYLELLGLKDRIISGPVIAKRAWLPETSFTCGRSGHFQIKRLHTILQQRIDETVKRNWDPERKYGILMRRRNNREITNHNDLVSLVQKIFIDFTFDIFDDDAIPNMPKIVAMFNRAQLVIGPHGAGLTNMLLCKPGTVFVEFLVNDLGPILVYPELAVHLGLVYHGQLPVLAYHSGKITLNITDAERMFRQIRQEMRQETASSERKEALLTTKN